MYAKYLIGRIKYGRSKLWDVSFYFNYLGLETMEKLAWNAV